MQEQWVRNLWALPSFKGHYFFGEEPIWSACLVDVSFYAGPSLFSLFFFFFFVGEGEAKPERCFDRQSKPKGVWVCCTGSEIRVKSTAFWYAEEAIREIRANFSNVIRKCAAWFFLGDLQSWTLYQVAAWLTITKYICGSNGLRQAGNRMANSAIMLFSNELDFLDGYRCRLLQGWKPFWGSRYDLIGQVTDISSNIRKVASHLCLDGTWRVYHFSHGI